VELRLRRQIGRARLVLDKAALIARYVDDLDATERRVSAAPPG
jgi:hypothetical protein